VKLGVALVILVDDVEATTDVTAAALDGVRVVAVRKASGNHTWSL